MALKDKEVIVVDDFLTPRYHAAILNFVSSNEFPWTITKNITHEKVDEAVAGLGGFGFQNHVIKFDGQRVYEDFSFLQPILMPFVYQIQDTFGYERYLRVRVDMTVYNPEKYYHAVHTDLPGIKHAACVYYLNDSDGETVIYNESTVDCPNPEDADLSMSNVKEVVYPKANRLVIFDGSLYHSGHSPSENKTRLIINSDFN